jgi:hypothetical protein
MTPERFDYYLLTTQQANTTTLRQVHMFRDWAMAERDAAKAGIAP